MYLHNFEKIRKANDVGTNILSQMNVKAYPSALPHCPGREEIHANNLPPANCSSIWESSLRSFWRFSSFLWTWLLFLVSSAAASASWKFDIKGSWNTMNTYYSIQKTTHVQSITTKCLFIEKIIQTLSENIIFPIKQIRFQLRIINHKLWCTLQSISTHLGQITFNTQQAKVEIIFKK